MTGGRLSSNLIINDSTGAKLSRGIHPGWGWCAWCGYPGAARRHSHETWYEKHEDGAGRSIFPLCDTCWGVLDVEDKLFAYRVYLLDTESLEKWPKVKAALLQQLEEEK